MIYYKYLELDYKHVQNQLKTHIKNNPELIEDGLGHWRMSTDWILENTDIQDLFKWEIDFIGIFVTHTKKGIIHIDNDSKPVRINFPILNCDNTTTKYFKLKGDTSFVWQPNGVGFIELQEQDVLEVDEFYLTQAVLMRVLEPHQVCSNGEIFPRVSCTVQFKENLEYLLNE